MLDMTFLQFIGSIGGVGAVFAILLFWVYRQSEKQKREDSIRSAKQAREDRKFMEDRLTQVLKDYNDICRENQRITSAHTEVMVQLITWLKARNGGR